LLLWNDGKMGRIDEWDDERDVRISPVIFGIGEYGKVGGSKRRFYIASSIRIQARKDDLAVDEILRFTLVNDHICHLMRNRRRLLPLNGLCIRLSRRSWRRAEGMDHKPRMIR